MTATTHHRGGDSNPTEADRAPERIGAGAGAGVGGGAGSMIAILAAVSPFDIARPLDGWTELHLRPLLVITALVAAVLLARRGDPSDRPLLAATAALVLGFAIAAAVSVDQATGFAVTVRVGVLGLVFAASAMTLGGRTERRRLVLGVGVGVVAAAFVGLVIQAAGGDRFGTDLLVGSVSVTRGVTRLTRPFSHANVAAMYLAPAVVLLTGAAVGSVGGRPVRPGTGARFRRSMPQGLGWTLVVGGAAALGALALSLTLSRGGLLALGAGLAVLATAGVRGRSGPRPIAVGLPLLIAAVAIGGGLVSGGWGPRLGATEPIGADPAAVAAEAPVAPTRSTIWGHAIDAWLDHPVTGVGPGRFGSHSLASTADGEAPVAHAHNPVLEALATGGLVAVLGLAVFAVTVISRAWPGRRTVPIGLSAALVAAMLPLVVDHPFAFSSSGNLAAVLGGAWYAAAREGGR